MAIKRFLLLTVFYLFLYCAQAQQWEIGTGTWLSPVNKNLGAQKSFQVGDSTGTDTLYSIGTVVHQLNAGGLTATLTDGTEIIRLFVGTDGGYQANFIYTDGIILNSVGVDATDVRLLSQGTNTSSVTVNQTQTEAAFNGTNGQKRMTVSNNTASLSLAADDLEFISGVYYEGGATDPFVEMSIFDPNVGADRASIQLHNAGAGGHPHFEWQLYDPADSSILVTEIHAHDQLVFENETGFKFETDTGDFIIDIASKGAGKVLTSDANGVATWEDSRPYTVYTALLTQTTTDAPTAIVLENTLGGTIVWSYNSAGEYLGTLTGAFTLNKSVGFATIASAGSHGIISFEFNVNANDFILTTYNPVSESLEDELLLLAPIEIRVYD